MLALSLAALVFQGLPYLPGQRLSGEPDELFAVMDRMTGDIDGDGHADFLVYATEQNGPLNGRVYAYSGANGRLLYAFGPVGNASSHPGAIDGAGDVDGDGREDILVGNSVSNRATVYSGSTGRPLFEFKGYGAGDGFGGAVCAAGDVDHDGHADVLIGTTQAATGYAVLYSGADGSILRAFRGLAAGDLFGLSLAVLGDVNGDGAADFAIGALGEGRSYWSPGVPPFVPPFRTDDNSGGVLVFSGADGSLLYKVLGSHPYDGFGYSLDAIGDVNNDGRTDFVVGTYALDNPPVSGYARIVSGADGSELFTLLADDGFHHGLVQACGTGDVDGDLVPDVLVSSLVEEQACEAQVFSGATGLPLFCYQSPVPSNMVTVDGGQDLDADGIPDFLIGISQAAYGAGYVQTFVSGH